MSVVQVLFNVVCILLSRCRFVPEFDRHAGRCG